MTEQYIYDQQVYGQNMQYQIGMQTSPIILQGANYGYIQQVYLHPKQARKYITINKEDIINSLFK